MKIRTIASSIAVLAVVSLSGCKADTAEGTLGNALAALKKHDLKEFSESLWRGTPAEKLYGIPEGFQRLISALQPYAELHAGNPTVTDQKEPEQDSPGFAAYSVEVTGHSSKGDQRVALLSVYCTKTITSSSDTPIVVTYVECGLTEIRLNAFFKE